MGRRAKKPARKLHRGYRAPAPAPAPASSPSFPPPPPPESSRAEIAKWLGYGGVILVLFETPSGFALLNYNGINLFRKGALKDIWVHFTNATRGRDFVTLLDFQTFKDKSRAINLNGFSDAIVSMILLHHKRGQKLAVGKGDYKRIIEAQLGIHCLCNETVMELMWGLKNLMKSLVPAETRELTTEDRQHMSKGMQLVLENYGFKVQPDMVDKGLITIAVSLYESEYCLNKYAEYLRYGGECLKKVSGIDSLDWDLQKLATALKLICYPKEKIETGDSNEMLSEDLASTLVHEAHKYERMLHKSSLLNIYAEILFARFARNSALEELKSSKAEGACTTQ